MYADDRLIGAFMGRLNRASGDLFRFVPDPRILPINTGPKGGRARSWSTGRSAVR